MTLRYAKYNMFDIQRYKGLIIRRRTKSQRSMVLVLAVQAKGSSWLS